MLSGRVQFIRGATLTGRLLTNGNPRDQAGFANISAYVTQDDNLYGQLVRCLLLISRIEIEWVGPSCVGVGVGVWCFF